MGGLTKLKNICTLIFNSSELLYSRLMGFPVIRWLKIEAWKLPPIQNSRPTKPSNVAVYYKKKQ